MGTERAAVIENMESMGFPRDQIDLAMRAAFYNPPRAVEYLLNGIPENLPRDNRPEQTPAAPTSPPPATGNAPVPGVGGDEPVNLFEQAAAAAQGGGRGAGAARAPAGGAGAAGASAGLAGLADAAAAGGNLDFLRNNAQFQQLRQIVQQQPQMLEPILQQVGTGNPALAQMIAQRPEEFLRLLAEDHDEDAALPPGAQAIQVTEAEREAIERASSTRMMTLYVTLLTL
jgi:UV excision repair protein RAD23